MDAVPFSMGNVTVCSAVPSYAGIPAITIPSDPARSPDAAALAAALRGELSGSYASPSRRVKRQAQGKPAPLPSSHRHDLRRRSR